MRQYWNDRSERERWVLALGALCILFYLFYNLLYSPLTTAIHNKRTELREKQQTLIWMQQVHQQSKKKKKRFAMNNAKLLAIIGNELTRGSLQHFPYQLQQTAVGDIQLSYELVPFNQFLSWLWRLNNHYAIVLKQFNAEHSASAGMVKLQVIIRSCE